ncbi:MAG: hypothetical protein IH604_21565 [Burkholderiales bacterium]|nr:hypothetical protein [Burkholderiales bacterium]
MLRNKRLLYLTSNQLKAHSLSRSGLVLDAAFERDDQGVASFTAYLAGSRNLYYLVVDVVEEDYHQDTIPALGRKDRRQVLGRKLGQRYRDTSLTLSMSLGFEKSERRNEKVLYAAFSNTQQFQPWLNALEQKECRLAGIYSTALLAPAVIRGAGLKLQRCLLVSVQATGLRQSYVEDGKIRFSRVGRLNLENADSVAASCASESARLQQYLVTMRLLPTVTTPIDVMVLAAGKYHAAIAKACRDSEVLRYHVIDADKQCGATGLKSFPPEAPCEALFMRAAGIAAPADQFGQERHRHYYRLWQISRGLYAAGLAAAAAGLLFAAALLLQIYSLRGQIETDQTQFRTLSAEYARLTATFPPAPTSTENLKTAIKQFHLLQAQTTTPADLYTEISKALADFPQVEIESIQWRIGKPPAEIAPKGGAPRAAAASAAPPSGVDLGYALAEVSAQVVGARRVDLRAITEMANQFIANLRKNPQLEVTGVSLPFALTSADTLSGDIGSERAIAENAAFSFTVGRKLGR